MEMKAKGFVICVGLPRTGSFSLKTALDQVLKGSAFHGFTFFDSSGHDEVEFWTKVKERRETSQDWRDFFQSRGYQACLDIACLMRFKEILRAYPDAKVVLGVRDQEKWYKSINEVILPIITLDHDRWPYPLLRWITGRKMHPSVAVSFMNERIDGCEGSLISALQNGKESSLKLYKDWKSQVEKSVPKNQLLIFDVRDGWKPLCEFLNIPVPSDPFPRVNDSDSFKRKWILGQLLGWGLTLVVPFTFAFILYKLFY